jgi:hypothetical protein
MLQEQKYGPPRSVLEKPAEVVAPPTALTKLEDGYRALLTWKEKDAGSTERFWQRKPTIHPYDIRLKGFFAGVKPTESLILVQKRSLIFTQLRSFRASKPVTFEPINVNSAKYGKIYAEDWAFWTENKNNATRRNNGGLNRLAQMKELKAQHAPNSNSWTALNAEETALRNKYLGGKSKSKSRSSRKN